MKKLILSLLLTCATIASSFSQLADNSFAPNFTVSAYQSWLSSAGQTSNGSYSLYSYLDAGYTVILDVSATWCGPCWNFHLTGALEDLYAAHGPAGFPGVNQGTTDDVMVFWIDASPSSDDASMMDGNGSIGNWIEPTTGNKIQYPMTNLASPAAFSNDYAIAGYPTVYKICPNRLVSEIGPGNAAALYSSIASCPPAASLPNDVGAISYNGELAHCQGAYTPKVTIQNNGLSNLTTASITVKQNGTTISTGTFSGSLTTYATSLVTCTPIANFKLFSKCSSKSISVLINSSYNFEISLHITIFLPEKFFLINGIILFIFLADIKKTKLQLISESIFKSSTNVLFFSGKKP